MQGADTYLNLGGTWFRLNGQREGLNYSEWRKGESAPPPNVQKQLVAALTTIYDQRFPPSRGGILGVVR